MVKSRAEIQREYRRRLRVDLIQYDLNLLKARQRKRKNYVLVARLKRAEKAERRKNNAIYLHRYRQKKRERQVAENECTMNASGYESACTSTEERLIVNMKFPNRRSGARVRISRALTKKSKECKKLQEEINELQKKYKRTLRSWQRMKKKTSDIQPPNTDELSASMTSTVSQSMTPRSKTKLQITEAGLSTKQSSMVKSQLLEM